MSACPLCHHVDITPFYRDKRRDYLQCTRCHLVFVPEFQRLDAQTEKAHYDLHENNAEDAGYRRFLARLATPLSEKLGENATGLDFGCGPGPTLSVMLEALGHRVALYDIYYHPDRAALDKTYDFVTATEVIEHLYQPDIVWQQWLNLVKSGGWLGLMTKMVIDAEAFANWHYKNDPTHVIFFSRATFAFLAERDKLELEFIGNDVILLRKPQ
ncbi:class I SAM-dependent methyltransferase [Vibrio sp. SM6]|uniref:Class I SAM-dependent methyltransferase n=1 Tax=Vibrio agarilyticus TaxID=2726741 RepID=A0A7X8TS97_9VIBR|nr:class I SAM-dependent methyltransferase [Vibrio agarilyticus]NLS13681.1 class I SAM-dependent methyltransferase [Vibrio agarilyticus]